MYTVCLRLVFVFGICKRATTVATRSNTSLSEHRQVWSATTCNLVYGDGGVAVGRTVATVGGGGHTFGELNNCSNITEVSNMFELSVYLVRTGSLSLFFSVALIFRISNSPSCASDSRYRLFIVYFLFFFISFTFLFFFVCFFCLWLMNEIHVHLCFCGCVLQLALTCSCLCYLTAHIR